MPQLPPKPVDISRITDATRELLLALGQGDKAEVMENTPRRVAEMYAQVINPADIDIEDDFKLFEAEPGVRGTVVSVDDVHYVSLCEHHLAPAFGVAYVSYCVDQHVVGYSKLKKGLNYLSRQPTLNERLLRDTLDIVAARVQPVWIMLALRSVHCCLAEKMGGPMQEIVTVHDVRGDPPPAEVRHWLDRVYASKPVFLGK